MQARALIASTGKLAAIGAAFLLFTPLARAQEVEAEASSPRLAPFQLSVKLEPAVAMPLTDPQSRLYEAGGGQTLKLLFGLTPYLSVGPSASFTALPASEAMASAGTSWSFGAGARVMRPHDAAAYADSRRGSTRICSTSAPAGSTARASPRPRASRYRSMRAEGCGLGRSPAMVTSSRAIASVSTTATRRS